MLERENLSCREVVAVFMVLGLIHENDCCKINHFAWAPKIDH